MTIRICIKNTILKALFCLFCARCEEKHHIKNKTALGQKNHEHRSEICSFFYV